MVTSADGIAYSQFGASRQLPAQRFQCACRDCAFTQEELRIADIAAMEMREDMPQTTGRTPICEEA